MRSLEPAPVAPACQKDILAHYSRIRDEGASIPSGDFESITDLLQVYGRCGQPDDLPFLTNVLDTFPGHYDRALSIAIFPILLRFEAARVSDTLRQWMQALIEEFPHRRSAALARYFLSHD